MTTQHKQKILDELYSFHRAGIKPGLKRTQSLLKELGNPESHLKAIHIAGTNGKGSTCSMLASVLSTAGYKVGLYTSPHLLEFNERIRINGVNISDNQMIPLLERMLPIAKQLDCTFFEITTALAFEHFKLNDVDFAVIETGMGGRYDSTNVLYPILTIITQIDLDHQEFLGDNLEAIALEKAGIFKPKVPIIVSDTHQELKDVFINRAEAVASPIFFTEEWYSVSNYFIDSFLNMNLSISDGINEYNNLKIEKAGRHQINNLKAVLSAFQFLKNEFPNLTETTLRDGLANIKQNTNLFGRIEILQKKPIMILDVAHNPSGAMVLASTLEDSPYSDTKFNIIFGVMADKDIKNILLPLHQFCDELIITKPETDRASSLQNISQIAKDLDFNHIKMINSVAEAVQYALNLNSPTLIVGSFYTAGEALEAIKLQNQASIS